MRKKILNVLTLCLLMAGSVSTGMQAQVILSDLTKGYAVGDVLEKNVYQDKKADALLNEWAGAFDSKGNELPSPVVVEPVLYPNYPEKGNAIRLGWDKGVKGSRFSCYPFVGNGKMKKGTYYLATVVRFDRLNNTSESEIIGLTPNVTGGAGKYRIVVRRDEEDKKTMYLGCTLGKVTAMAERPCVVGQTYLVVLKVDFTAGNVSLFINPDLKDKEGTAAAVAMPDEENTTKWPLRAVSLRNRNAYAGAVGGIRLTQSWEDLKK